MMSVINSRPKRNSVKFFIGGGLIVIAVVIMIISATQNNAEFYMTITELQTANGQYEGENLRVSGAVIGDSINYDPDSEQLFFTIANIPDDETVNAQLDPAQLLHEAVTDPSNPRLNVIYAGAKPEMLRDEAQAIVTGTVDRNGIFLAEELLLKCPSKYQEAP